MELSKLSVNKIRNELWTCYVQSEQRCLRRACEWIEDLIFALPEEGEEKLLTKLDKDYNDTFDNFNPEFEQAKICFEMHEYDRAAYLIRNQMHDDKSRFLHYFAKFKAAEKKRVDLINDVSVNIPKRAILKFNELRDSLERSMDQREPDGWLLYVYVLVLYKFKLYPSAFKILQTAINKAPSNWSAWYMLSLIIVNRKQLDSLTTLPNHIFKVLFYHTMRLDLDITKEEPWTLVGPKETKNFLDKYFKSSLYVRSLLAKSLNYQFNKTDEAIQIFAKIREEDPFRVDSMEVYSNLLYVKKMRKELSKLAYEIEKVDPFTTEANSCIANSFSVREQHTKAIVYFTRSLRINPDLSNSWTLIGHEYLEMKSIDKALQAYRYAISINKRDCRAWIGLGNTFETIMSSPNVNNPNFEPCLYYYSQVGKYRPKDHIMYIAMGSIFEKMKEINRAIVCYKKAGPDGLLKLSKLYEANDMRDEAFDLQVHESY